MHCFAGDGIAERINGEGNVDFPVVFRKQCVEAFFHTVCAVIVAVEIPEQIRRRLRVCIPFCDGKCLDAVITDGCCDFDQKRLSAFKRRAQDFAFFFRYSAV